MTSEGSGKRGPARAARNDEAAQPAVALEAAWAADARRPVTSGRRGPGSTRLRASAAGQGRPEARPARQPRGLRAAAGPRPDRDPRGAGGGPAPRASSRCATSGWRSRPFAYYRGTPAVMAFDLAGTPRTDIEVQASGDAHLSNFGLFASPERTLVFDANDFDETLPGPWEWDVKRLAASMVIAGGPTVSAPRRTAWRRWPRSAATGSGWTGTPACGCSTSGTRRSRTADLREAAVATGLLTGRSGATRRQVLWRPSSPRLAPGTACAPSSR